MISADTYLAKVKLFFSFLVDDFHFQQITQTETGNAFYDIEFRKDEKVVSVSYETIEDYLQVIIFILRNGQRQDFNDKSNTIHLKDLNKEIFPRIDKNEIAENNLVFDKLETSSELDRKLLKSAKELRLVLKYWDSVG